jgi:ferredoxin
VLISIEPLKQKVAVNPGERLLSAINRDGLNVPFLCGGKGLCATCHIHVESGEQCITKKTTQEEITLRTIVGSQPNSRLACQTCVFADGLSIRVPEAMYIGSLAELEALIGRRAGMALMHPITGEVLIEKGKLVLRSTLEKLKSEDIQFSELTKQPN